MTSWESPSAETASPRIDHASEAAFTAPATTVISGPTDDAVSMNVGNGRLEESITTPGGPFSPSQVVLILCGLIASGKVLILDPQVLYYSADKESMNLTGDRAHSRNSCKDTSQNSDGAIKMI
jgi:hypothetical protein